MSEHSRLSPHAADGGTVPRRFYFAGALFSCRELIGNAVLAERIGQLSGGRWLPLLPQEAESGAERSIEIRDHDLELLFRCDALIANFDGPDLDSGTVAEFLYAKMLDLPAVLLRTDFRFCGDQRNGGDPWNLMCSGYPRTRSVVLDAMALYREHFSCHGSIEERSTRYLGAIAAPVVAALDAAAAEPAWLARTDAPAHYRRVVRSAGGDFAKRLPDEEIDRLIAGKIGRNLL